MKFGVEFGLKITLKSHQNGRRSRRP
jgi:hypothetical protein